MNSARQEHDGESPTTRHSEFGPQGEGWHGSFGGASWIGSTVDMIFWLFRWKIGSSSKFTYECAADKWISCMTIWTAAVRTMVCNRTSSVNTTDSRARIPAFLVETCQVQWTFRVCGAFWSTIGWTSYVSLYARADCLLVMFATLTIRSARRWVARILNYWFYKKSFSLNSVAIRIDRNHTGNRRALYERIA